MLRKVLIGIVILGMLYGCATSSNQGTKSRKPTGKPPVVVDYYAVEVIRPGDTWRLYLQAKDEDGDMSYIAALLYQPGVGYYPTSTIHLEEDDRKEFEGYIFLFTPSGRGLSGDRLEFTVVVWDKHRNGSKNLNVQLTFGSVTTEEVPEKWQLANNNTLGAFNFDIRSAGYSGK
jgi:hypothetical protein